VMRPGADIQGAAEHASNNRHKPHAMAAALVLILGAYVLALPFFGYVLSIGVLIAAVAWLGGVRQWRPLLLCALLAGPVLWLIFDQALAISLPVGFWPFTVN